MSYLCRGPATAAAVKHTIESCLDDREVGGWLCTDDQDRLSIFSHRMVNCILNGRDEGGLAHSIVTILEGYQRGESLAGDVFIAHQPELPYFILGPTVPAFLVVILL